MRCARARSTTRNSTWTIALPEMPSGATPRDISSCSAYIATWAKTGEETQSLGIEDIFPLLSRFNAETWAAFVNTAKPPPSRCGPAQA